MSGHDPDELTSFEAIPGTAPSEPEGRIDGYAPIESYAAIGDGRSVALVARGGSVDWLAAPSLASPSVFGAVLDADRGGSFALAPVAPFGVERRYADDTNVLETTFTTAEGIARVTDALLLGTAGTEGHRRLLRRVECLSGRVELAWRIEPRFDFARARVEIEADGEVTTASGGGFTLVAQAWDAGEPERAADAIAGSVALELGQVAHLLVAAGGETPAEPWVRDEAEHALDATAASWRAWASGLDYDGPWRDAVVRSALALKLLVYEPTGAVAAAATTSLPEAIGAERNWDYRYSWIRDASLALDALLGLGCRGEAEQYFGWLEGACHDAAPDLRVVYALDGKADLAEHELDLDGYRGSRPVRIGNGAVDQLQLGLYGDLLQTTWLYVRHGYELSGNMADLVADTADFVCKQWHKRDSGIWEARGPAQHFTHSKMMCALALDRAAELAVEGRIRADELDRWRANAAAVRSFVETRCWSDELGSYARAADTPGELDASLLLSAIVDYAPPEDERLQASVDAVRRGLGNGPCVYRYRTDDGLAGNEGAFLACSFWLAGAWARMGRLDDAAEQLEAATALANDVGLFSEEIDPETNAFLGNFPQAFTHLALVNAAVTIERRTG